MKMNCGSKDELAAVLLQKIVRKNIAKKKTTALCKRVIEPFYDERYERHFYYNHNTGISSWKCPYLLAREVNHLDSNPTPEIQRLKYLLWGKENEINSLKHSSETMKLANEIKIIKSWSVDDVINFFKDSSMDKYIQKIQEFRVDGNLLLNMDERDWNDIGVRKSIDIKRIYLTLADKGLNNINFNHFLQMIDNEKKESTIFRECIGSFDANIKSTRNNNDFSIKALSQRIAEDPSEESKVSIEVIYPGEEGKKPSDGSVAKVHYTIALLDGTVIESSRDRSEVPFEFVVGDNQVINGFDSSIKKMCKGEKSKIKVEPKLAYGNNGLVPVIPANATLFFEVELIDFGARPPCFKPWIQRPGFNSQQLHKQK